MSTSVPTFRPIPTPAWLVYASLAMTAIFFLSERWRWFPFNEHKGWTVLFAGAGVGVVLLLMLGWFLAALFFRRQFQFGIRTLLVLTVAVALPFSWLAVEMKKAREQREAVEAIAKSRGSVWCDPEIMEAIRPGYLQRLLGGDFFANVLQVVLTEDAQMIWLKGLPKVHTLMLYNEGITRYNAYAFVDGINIYGRCA